MSMEASRRLQELAEQATSICVMLHGKRCEYNDLMETGNELNKFKNCHRPHHFKCKLFILEISFSLLYLFSPGFNFDSSQDSNYSEI